MSASRPVVCTYPANTPETDRYPEAAIKTAPANVCGIHCLLELTGCPRSVLSDETFIRQAVTDAAEVSGSTLLSLTSHAFSPCGVTALGLLAESHISIHTWPENGYAAVDIFTCGTNCHPTDACSLLAERLEATHSGLRTLTRGNTV